jgi:hypothetical protein
VSIRKIMILSADTMVMGTGMGQWSQLIYRPVASGIPPHYHRNQRKRRKQHHQTRPHGWKGGAQ